MVKIATSSGLITTSHNTYISPLIFDLYSDYNSDHPSDQLEIIELSDLSKDICRKIGVGYNPSTFKSLKTLSLPTITNKDHKKVVLGFSGGLDSVYQAISLQEQGYCVILYHLKGINTYENGQATKRCPGIAEKLGCEYVESVISKKQGHQQVPENPLKNELIMSLMIDYCLENDISYISLGDDLNLSLGDSVIGVNVTDSRELTLEFTTVMMRLTGVHFLPINSGAEKLDRIKKLIEYGLEDDYYSCVQAGRLNRYLHEHNKEKYGVELFDGNCGCSCRKCALHNLLLHYGRVKRFPQKFINDCWRRLWDNTYSADYELFRPDLSEEQRLKNLFNY